MYLADTLSRATLNIPAPLDLQEEVFPCNSEDALNMFQVELETMELESPFLPLKLQSTMLKKLDQGLQGGESMICRAREVMYWYGMQAAILQESAKCSLSPSYGSAL